MGKQGFAKSKFAVTITRNQFATSVHPPSKILTRDSSGSLAMQWVLTQTCAQRLAQLCGTLKLQVGGCVGAGVGRLPGAETPKLHRALPL